MKYSDPFYVGTYYKKGSLLLGHTVGKEFMDRKYIDFFLLIQTPETN